MHYFAALFIALVAVVGGAIVFTDLPDAVTRFGLIEERERGDDREQEDALRAPSDTKAATERESPGPFDIAKIDPNGTSVFAGRSAPNSAVSVLADGALIGTVNTDGNGEWVLITERQFPNPNPKLSIQVGSIVQQSPPSRTMEGEGLDLRSAEAVSAHLMDALRLRVERARANAERATKTVSTTVPAQLHEVAAERQVPEALVATAEENLTVTTSDDVLPVPIKFIFREAEFTDDGAKAAQLLLDYLILSRPPLIRMTGHADERGNHDFNMKLSADRLKTVMDFLRAGGYAGQVELFPKGDTEPFQGIDRTLVPRDQLYELDRRVELQISE
jgi:outer membrane protein OmpA-like peptidoglycan-associated protein